MQLQSFWDWNLKVFLLKIIYFLQTCRKIAWQLHFRSIAAAFFEGPLEIQKIANHQLKMQQKCSCSPFGTGI